MNPELETLLKHMERFNEINKSDIPTLIKLVREYDAEVRLALLQMDILEKRLEKLE
jgi:hypothetical protein